MARVRTVADRREAPPKRREPASERSPDAGQPEKKVSKPHHHHDELRLLQDSLSTFFTPTTGRRSRAPPKKFEDEDEKNSQKGGVKMEEGREMRPLSIDTDCVASSSMPADENLSSNGQEKSPAVSPARRACERLMDSLSPYFSAASEKRSHKRSSKPSESFVFPGGSETSQQAATSNNGLLSPPAASGGSGTKKMKGRKGEDLKKVVGGRSTQNSASAALFGSPVDTDTARTSSDTDHAIPQKSRRAGNKFKTPKTEPLDDGYPEASPPSAAIGMKEKKKKKTLDLAALSPSSSGNGEKENLEALGSVNGEINITEKGLKRFHQAQKLTQDSMEKAMKEFVDPSAPEKEPHWPGAIRIGKYEIKTWYSAPFPQEYSTTPILYICEYCLHYGKSAQALTHHRLKCSYRNPPGNEIYRKDSVSIFEVDGNVSRIYCQNLCLIAKLFLDHKTLYYDVEPFLFYVATTNDEYGFHLVGYFSKEKYSSQKFNLSCIVTLPCYQKRGYGRFLIDFSFLLSRREGMLGSPERPLSDLGRISYASYWRTAVLEWLWEFDKQRKALIPDIATGTGISIYDVVEMLDALQWFNKGSDGVELNINWTMVEAQFKKAKADKARIWIDENALRWIPVQHSPTKDFGLRSPVRLSTPHRSPTTANVGSTPTGVSIAAVGSTIKKGSGPPKSSKKNAARRKLALTNRKLSPPSTSGLSSSEDEAHVAKENCKDASRRGIHHHSSPDDSEVDKAPKNNKAINGLVGRQTNNSASTSVTFARRTTNRGKGIFEGDLSSSSSSTSEDDDKDVSFSLGNSKGKKPAKGKNPPPPRKRKPPPKKLGKSPGKVFPPNYGKIGEPTSPVARCDSVASSATVPMRLEEPMTPGGGRSLRDVEDEYQPAPSYAYIAPSTSSPVIQSRRSSRCSIRRGPLSSSDSSRMHSPVRKYRSDSSSSRPHSPIIRTRSSTPSPGRQEHQQLIMNMGGVPDDETNSRCGAMSVESDQPPRLHPFIGVTNDDVPPILPPEHNGEAPPLLRPVEEYNTDDDEAPPQLSPVSNNNDVEDVEDPELDPDKQPMAPLTEEQRQIIAMDQPPKAPIKRMDEEHMNSFDASAGSIMEPSSSKSVMQQSATPQQTTYPGSLIQNTPGSVPSCSIQNQTTPEMQAAFMSPSMVMQPNSVSSVHGVPPNGTIDQGWVPPAAPPSDPSTPLRNVRSAGSFGSPSGAVQIPGPVQQMRASVDAPSSSRRSGEGSRKRNQQQQQQQQQQLPHAQFGMPYGMQMNPLNPMQQYMPPQYPGYGAAGYGFDPAAYQQAAAANQFWHGYANPQAYGKANGAAMVPGNMMPPGMMYPNYQNGMNNMVHNVYRQAAGYPPAAFNTTPNNFPSGLPGFNYPNQFFK